MWEIGEIILYGTQGLCKIDNIVTRDFLGQMQEYYVLGPISDMKSTFYVPVSSSDLCARMHKLLTPDEAKNLICSFPNLEAEWIENDKVRAKAFKDLIESGEREKTASVLRAVWLKRQELEKKGKKLRACDQSVFEKGEKSLFDEFSHVFGIDRCNVLPMIKEILASLS